MAVISHWVLIPSRDMPDPLLRAINRPVIAYFSLGTEVDFERIFGGIPHAPTWATPWRLRSLLSLLLRSLLAARRRLRRCAPQLLLRRDGGRRGADRRRHHGRQQLARSVARLRRGRDEGEGDAEDAARSDRQALHPRASRNDQARLAEGPRLRRATRGDQDRRAHRRQGRLRRSERRERARRLACGLQRPAVVRRTRDAGDGRGDRQGSGQRPDSIAWVLRGGKVRAKLLTNLAYAWGGGPEEGGRGIDRRFWMPPRLDGLTAENFDASSYGRAVAHIRKCTDNASDPECEWADVPTGL